MKPQLLPCCGLLGLVLLLLGCHRARIATLPVGQELAVLGVTPDGSAPLWLNDSLAVAFSHDLDLASLTPSAVRFFHVDGAQGPGALALVRGTFHLRELPGDAAGNRRVLEFRPALPLHDAAAAGGLRHVGLAPTTRYLMEIAGADSNAPSLLRDVRGQALRATFSLRFATVEEASSAQLFADTKAGGPRVVEVTASPRRDDRVALGRLTGEPVEVRVRFDQPLYPAPQNLVLWRDREIDRVDTRAVTGEAKGRVFLEYDDPEFGRDVWLPASVQVEVNDADGCTLVLLPRGVLPNDASLRVIVESTLQDIAGESNVGNATHARVAATLRTEAARAPQFDALVETFDNPDHIDLEAAFLEPAAEIGRDAHGGFVRARLDFEGRDVTRDFRPRVPEVLLNTDHTHVMPEFGASFDVVGGVFEFRNVTIPRGVVVRGIGTKPMVWLVTGDFVVEGELNVGGGDGALARGVGQYEPGTPAYGGRGVCGGGRGGHGSPSVVDSDLQGESGFGPFQEPNGGGPGGRHSCTVSSCGRGGGGGGGSFTTLGDPHHVLAWLGGAGLPGVGLGAGGRMCGPTPPVGPRVLAGPSGFRDGRPDNDFYGVGVDVRRGLRVVGELLTPRGGSGGGGGGDSGVRCPPNAQFLHDSKGGGGGGGAGALLVKALGRVIIRSTGVITANGGGGGGGFTLGSNSNAGGGGGGSGGTVVLMAGQGIHIATHGAAYADATLTGNANGAYTFAIEADGGVGLRGPFQGNAVAGKYPGRGGPSSAASFDFNPIGGFGGLGLVQLMAPAGDNLPVAQSGDGTNTRLDDHVFFYPDDARLDRGLVSDNPNLAGAMVGSDKIRFLGWRGLIDERGVGRDDQGNVVVLPHSNHGEGDIRPSPVLLPSPFGALSRVRSRWLDTGATARRADRTGSDGTARTLVERIDPLDPSNPFTNLRAGPTWLFAGTFGGAQEPKGYVAYQQTSTGIARRVPEVLPVAVAVASIVSDVTWRGTAAHRVELSASSAILGQNAGRYVGYRASLRGRFGEALDSYRILWHDDRALVLAAEGPLAVAAALVVQVQVVADLIGFDGGHGGDFGGVRVERGRNVPLANARVGFAFHTNPNRPRLVGGLDLNRWPREPNTFLFELDLSRPDVLRQVRDLGKTLGVTDGPTWVQYDVTFNTAFSEGAAGQVDPTRPASVRGPRPSLRWLVLPVQF